MSWSWVAVDNSFENRLCVQTWGERELPSDGLWTGCLILISFDFDLACHQSCVKLQACQIPCCPTVLQTFQINSLFALDSIKYLHVVLNIHNICVAQVRSFVLNVPPIMRKVSCQGRVKGGHLRGQKQDLYIPERCCLGRSRTLEASDRQSLRPWCPP